MGKRQRVKAPIPQKDISKRPDDSMVTQQEERLLFRDSQNKKRTLDSEEEGNGQRQFELSKIVNLNQNSTEEVTQFINKLISKNKVNSKNAFDVPLIHLEQLEDYRASLNEHTWKRISSTLENDYKIYGYRVDATHNITYKMLESIARHETASDGGYLSYSQLTRLQGHVSDSEGNRLQQGSAALHLKNEYQSPSISSSKVSVDYLKFIEKNIKLLNIGQLEAFFSYNPALERTKRKFDQQGLRGLLLNNIPLRDKVELRLDESIPKTTASMKMEPIDNVTVMEYQQLPGQQEIFKCAFDEHDSSSIEEEEQRSNYQYPHVFEAISEFCLAQGFITGKGQGEDLMKLYKIISGEEPEESNRKQKKTNQKIDPENAQQRNEDLNNNQAQAADSKHERESNDQKGKNAISPQINEAESGVIEPGSNANSALLEAKELLPIQQEAEPSRALKKFELLEMKVDNEEEDNEESVSALSSSYKLMNIDSYISINPKVRKRRAKFELDQLSADEIGEKVFAHKPHKKRKISNSSKDKASNAESAYQSRFSFRELLGDKDKYHKRSVVLKRSAYEDRVFENWKAKLRLKEKQTNKGLSKAERKQKIKNCLKGLELPLYESLSDNDINRRDFINQFSDLVHGQCPLSQRVGHEFYYPSFFGRISSLREQLSEKERVAKEAANRQQNDPLQEGPRQAAQLHENAGTHSEIRDGPEVQHEIGRDQSSESDDYPTRSQVNIRDIKEKLKVVMEKCLLKLRKDTPARNSCLNFHEIYKKYEKKEGKISPALCFLTVLHLANQNNLALQENLNQSDFQIYNDGRDEVSEAVTYKLKGQIQQEEAVIEGQTPEQIESQQTESHCESIARQSPNELLKLI